MEDKKARKVIEDFFRARQTDPKDITKNNWKQALIPEGALVVENKNGTAPGLIVREDNKHIILLPNLRLRLQLYPTLRLKMTC